MELADVTDSKSVGATRAGSSPATGTSRESRRASRVRGFSFCYGFVLALKTDIFL